MINSLEREFCSEEIARMARVTPRQIQWWDEKRIVRPLLIGHRRVYTAQDAIEVMMVAKLRDKGVSLQRIRRVLYGLKRVSKGEVSEIMSGRSDLYLVIDDQCRKFNFTTNKDRALEMVIESAGPALVIHFQELVRQMNAAKLRRSVAA